MKKLKQGVSVIIPCYNAGEYLSQAVESVKIHLAGSIFEVIISDDGSNDNGITENIIDLYDGEKGIKIIKSSLNRGAQFARNSGLDKADYPYIFMLDSDDLLNNKLHKIETQNYARKAIHILQNQDIGFVHSTTKMFGNYHGYTISPYPLKENLIVKKHHVPTYILYRKDDAIKEGIYNTQIKKWQDWSAGIGLLNARIKKGYKNEIGFLNTPYILYREHSGESRISRTHVDEKDMVLKTIQLYPEIFEKYYPNLSQKEIAQKVMSYKPCKIKDLLYVANYNSIHLANKIMKERGWYLSGKKICLEKLICVSIEKGIETAMQIIDSYQLKLQSDVVLGEIP